MASRAAQVMAPDQCHSPPALGWPLWPGMAAGRAQEGPGDPFGLFPAHRQGDTAKDVEHSKEAKK